MNPIRAYTDAAILGELPPVLLLQPFLGRVTEDPLDPRSGRFNDFFAHADRLIKQVELVDAEVAVLPFDYGHVLQGHADQSDVSAFLARARDAGCRAIVFCWHDSDERLPLDDAFIVRTALTRDRRGALETVLPTWNEDFVERYCGGEAPVRDYEQVPVVSFCGRSLSPCTPLPSRLLRRVRRTGRWLAGRASTYPYLELRADCMRRLQAARRIDTEFLARRGFWGRGSDRSEPVTAQERRAVRREYVNNMLRSDYVLCVRGAGNFSMRFYEALSMGRTPLLIHTGGMLPFDDLIDWDRICLRVRREDVRRLGDIVNSHHRRLSAEEFCERQREARRAWVEYLSPLGFLTTLLGRLRLMDGTLSTDA